MRRVLPGVLACLISMNAWPGDKPPDRAAAAMLNDLGVAYMNQQRMDKAVEEFDAALKADPTLTAAELNKGIALLNLQKLPEAEATLNAAASQDPSDPRAWYNLGLLRRTQGKSAEAIAAFQRVVQIDPNDPDTHYFLGTMYSQLRSTTRPSLSSKLRCAYSPYMRQLSSVWPVLCNAPETRKRRASISIPSSASLRRMCPHP